MNSIKNILKSILGYFKPFISLFLITLVIFTISRIVFTYLNLENVNGSFTWSKLLFSGFRLDISTIGYPCVLVSLLVFFTQIFGFSKKLNKPIIKIVACIIGLLVGCTIILEAATPAFLNEYGVRPNRFFVEYLKYPQEVFAMLMNGFLTSVIVATLLFITACVSAYIFFKRQITKSVATIQSNKLIVSLSVIFTCFILSVGISILMARSSLGHRPLNPAMVAFSSNNMTNELVLNSSYSLIYAVSRIKTGASSDKIYGSMDQTEMFSLLLSDTNRTKEQFVNATAKNPTLSYNKASHQRDTPLNIVILLQESLGAQFSKRLGGLDLTPNLDKLFDEGWMFTNAFATGTRSIRGIEAVVTGFLPTINAAVVKQPKSQYNFFTLPALLKAKGYDTSFIYGGETHFDNMKSFFLANGISEVIGQSDYENPTFVASWGVCDEDLMRKANEEFIKKSKSNKPFFSLVFSSSNHVPFEIPEGKIELYEEPAYSRNNAVKYADYAIGKFFELAKKEEYYKNTIFVVVADHDSRVSGASLVPVQHFHIPVVFLGADIESRVDERLISQIDIAPTLLSYAGIDASYPMIGMDLNNSNSGGRAIMQYDKNFAYMWREDNDNFGVQMLTPQNTNMGYIIEEHKLDVLKPTKWSEDIVKKAHAWSIAGAVIYDKELYGSDYLKNK